MSYSHKIHRLFQASLEASEAFDTAWEALSEETVQVTEDYGRCPLCNATMYYCMDYTHEDDCPIETASRMHDLFQDAIDVLDHDLAQKLIEAGRESELRDHPLDASLRSAYEAAIVPSVGDGQRTAEPASEAVSDVSGLQNNFLNRRFMERK